MNNDKHLAQHLEKDIEDSFPSSGGGASFMMMNAPTVFISRDTKINNRIVPVYFIACQKKGVNCSDQLLRDMYEGSGGMALLGHRYEGKALGKCVIVPFLYHMLPSAKSFCSGIERYLVSLQHEIDITWRMEFCHVSIMHKDMEYEPSNTIQSLQS